MAVTFNNLYLDIRQKLIDNGISSASLEAKEIVCYGAEKKRDDFYRVSQLYVSPQVERNCYELLARRVAGQPIAYITGEWDFYDLNLVVTPDVLIPRPDTELLVEETIKEAKSREKGVRILDLCCGSGCVGLAVAKHVPDCKMVLGDKSEAAIKIARQNLKRVETSAIVSCVQMDAMAPAPISIGSFDIIVSNPPYIATEEIKMLDASVRDFEPHMALDGGEDGMDFYRSICSKWRYVLKDGGRLIFECGINQAFNLCDLLAANGFGDLIIKKDLQGIDRVVSAKLM